MNNPAQNQKTNNHNLPIIDDEEQITELNHYIFKPISAFPVLDEEQIADRNHPLTIAMEVDGNPYQFDVGTLLTKDESLERDIFELTLDNSQQDSRLDKLEEERVAHQEQLDRHEDDIDSIQATDNQQDVRLAKLEEERVAHQEQLDRHEDDIDSIQATDNQQDVRLAKLEEEQVTHQEQLDRHENMISALELKESDVVVEENPFILPIGYTYAQYPEQKSPQELFPQYRWKHVMQYTISNTNDPKYPHIFDKPLNQWQPCNYILAGIETIGIKAFTIPKDVVTEFFRSKGRDVTNLELHFFIVGEQNIEERIMFGYNGFCEYQNGKYVIISTPHYANVYDFFIDYHDWVFGTVSNKNDYSIRYTYYHLGILTEIEFAGLKASSFAFTTTGSIKVSKIVDNKVNVWSIE